MKEPVTKKGLLMSKRNVIHFFLTMCIFGIINTYPHVCTVEQLDAISNKVQIHFEIEPGDFIYKDYLDIAVDNPQILLSDVQYSLDTQPYYDPTFRETKKIFNQSFTLTLIATSKEAIDSAYMHVTYYQHSKKHCITELFPLFKQLKSSQINQNLCIDSHATSIIHGAPTSGNNSENNLQNSLLDWLRELLEMLWHKKIVFILFAICLFMLPHLISIVLALLGAIFYMCYLALPLHMLLWFIALCFLCLGLYLLIIPIKKENRHWYMSVLGMLLIGSSIIGFAKAYSYTYMHRIYLLTSKKIIKA